MFVHMYLTICIILTASEKLVAGIMKLRARFNAVSIYKSCMKNQCRKAEPSYREWTAMFSGYVVVVLVHTARKQHHNCVLCTTSTLRQREKCHVTN